jgi:hypothetical protein
MDRDIARVVGTCGIWFAVIIIGVAAITNAMFMNGVLVFLLVMIMAIAAASATQSIWGHAHAETSQNADKIKRRSRVDRVLERMNDDELDELRARLMSESDGEAVSLNDLLAERDRRKS